MDLRNNAKSLPPSPEAIVRITYFKERLRQLSKVDLRKTIRNDLTRLALFLPYGAALSILPRCTSKPDDEVIEFIWRPNRKGAHPASDLHKFQRYLSQFGSVQNDPKCRELGIVDMQILEQKDGVSMYDRGKDFSHNIQKEVSKAPRRLDASPPLSTHHSPQPATIDPRVSSLSHELTQTQSQLFHLTTKLIALEADLNKGTEQESNMVYFSRQYLTNCEELKAETAHRQEVENIAYDLREELMCPVVLPLLLEASKSISGPNAMDLSE